MKIIKQFATCVSATILILPLMTHAAPTRLCGFIDYFAIAEPAGASILGQPYTLGNLSYEQQSDTYFNLQCGDGHVFSGSLFIDVGFDNNNKCSLTITDGPFASPLVVDSQCKGVIHYNGIDSTVPHSYNLRFST